MTPSDTLVSTVTSILIAAKEFVDASAAGLLLGFFLAALLHVFVRGDLVQKLLGKPGLGAVLKASAVGVPLPLCSCSVIPLALSLRKKGASRGATASFLISTPEIGVDSFLLSYILLGPWFALLRVVVSFCSAFTVGAVIDLAKLDSSHDAPSVPPPCCKKVEKPAEESPVVLLGKPNSAPDTCCHPPAPPSTLFIRIVQGLRFGFIDLIDDTAHVLTVSFLLAGCIAVFVPADLFAAIGLSPTASMLLMLVLSFPLYVCATSSTPLAAALLAKGLNPGAALVFLLAGPASNTATMVAIRDHLGRASLITYLAGISLLSLTAGFLVNASGLIPLTALREPEAHHHTHSIASVILLTLLALSAIRKVQRAQLAR